MEYLPQGLGSVVVEGVSGPFGSRGAGHQSIQTPLVEVVDSVAHRLLSAAQVPGYLRELVSLRTCQKHLGAAQGESVFGAQSSFELFAFVV